MAAMQLSVQVQLPIARVKVNGVEQQCLGVAEFRTSPTRHGLGASALHAMEAIAAEQNMQWIVGFTDKPTTAFYVKCGWCVAVNSITSQLDGLVKLPVYRRVGGATPAGATIEPVGQDW
jgi:hypothetical protein